MRNSFRIFLLISVLLFAVLSVSCTVENSVSAEPVMKVHYIDVGQGDSTLIQLTDGRNILIDGGNKADAPVISKYLQGLNIKTIDYLIATHPHEDHIGSLPAIIKDYKIGAIYMPKATANTKIFEDLLLAIKSKGLKINTASAGVKIIDSPDIKLVLVAPNSTNYENLNDFSAVAKLTYKKTSFLFTGDAEVYSENEILKKAADIKADVIKLGHHGSRTSSSESFIKKVAPKYAIISTGKDNDYGHPHSETLSKLKKLNILSYRTDQLGTIIAISDGNAVSINKTPVSTDISKTTISNVYIGNKNSKVYHLPTCSSLPNPENQVKLKNKEEALKGGFKACQKCKP